MNLKLALLLILVSANAFSEMPRFNERRYDPANGTEARPEFEPDSKLKEWIEQRNSSEQRDLGELYLDPKTGWNFPVNGDSNLVTFVSDSIFEVVGTAPGTSGSGIMQEYLADANVVPDAVGGTNSRHMVKRVRAHEIQFPKSYDALTNGRDYVFRTQSYQPGRNYSTNLTDNYRAEWLSRACLMDEVLGVVWFDGDGNKLGEAFEEDYKVATTDYSENPNRLYLDNRDSEIVVGMQITVDSPDLAQPPQDNTRYEPSDKVGPSVAGNYTRAGFPVDLVYRKKYRVVTATDSYIELEEWNGAGALDLGSDASVEIHVKYGFSLSHTYSGTSGTGHGVNIETITYRGYHSRTVILHASANDAVLNSWQNMTSNIESILSNFRVRNLQVMVIIPNTGSFASRGPTDVVSLNWQKVRRELIRKYPQNHFDLQVELNKWRTDTEIALLSDPYVPELIPTLGGTPEAPDKLGSVESWVGPNWVRELGPDGRFRMVDLGYFPLSVRASITSSSNIHWDKRITGKNNIRIFRDGLAQWIIDKGWFKPSSHPDWALPSPLMPSQDAPEVPSIDPLNVSGALVIWDLNDPDNWSAGTTPIPDDTELVSKVGPSAFTDRAQGVVYDDSQKAVFLNSNAVEEIHFGALDAPFPDLGIQEAGGTGELMLLLWFKPADNPFTGFRDVIAVAGNTGSTTQRSLLRIGSSATNDGYNFSIGSGTSARSRATSTDLNDGDWQHLAIYAKVPGGGAPCEMIGWHNGVEVVNDSNTTVQQFAPLDLSNLSALTIANGSNGEDGYYRRIVLLRDIANSGLSAAELVARDYSITEEELLASWLDRVYGSASTSEKTPDYVPFPENGMSNVEYYAFGISVPTEEADSPVVLSLVENSGKRLSVQFPRNESATDIVYEVEASSDLVDWEVIARSSGGQATVDMGSMTHELSETGESDVRSVYVEDAADSVSEPIRFMRLGVSSN